METTPIDFGRWYEAAKIRRSSRAYTGSPDEGQLQRLSLLALALQGDGVRVALIPLDAKIMRNPGGTGHAALIIARKDAEPARSGYKGEALVLEAAAMGLGTCWRGSGWNPKAAALAAKLGEDERIMSLITIGAIGEPLQPISDAARKRRKIEKIVTTVKGTSLADMNEWQNSAVKCARIAPSALNLQPWRFGFARDMLCMTFGGMFNKAAELELGIAMLHVELGASAAGRRGFWRRDGEIWVFAAQR